MTPSGGNKTDVQFSQQVSQDFASQILSVLFNLQIQNNTTFGQG